MPRFICLVVFFGTMGLPTAYGKSVPEPGGKIYQERCAVCHGEGGDGRGPAAPSLNPKPTDFTSGLFKYRSTSWGSPPLASDLERTIRDGLNGTAMPGWSDLLSLEEIRALIDVLMAFSATKVQSRIVSIAIPDFPFEKAGVDEGRKLYIKKGCIQCHGPDGRGDGPLAGQLQDGEGRLTHPRDLSDHRNYRWRAAPRDIYLRIATGLNGTPMQGYADQMSPQEIAHLTTYLKWLYEQEEKTRWIGSSRSEEPLRRGEYLVSVMVCQLCHTPVNEDASYREDLRFAGGMRVSSFPDGTYYSRNLTPDPGSGLGQWNLDDIKRAITRGTAKNGRLLYPFDMPWLAFSNLTDRDAEAIAIYLKSLKPIYNKIPPPRPSGFWASLLNKTRLLLGRERTLEYHGGNSGETDPEIGKEMMPAKHGYWSLLPPIGWVPVEKVIESARPQLPLPDRTGSAAEDAKRMHGRYLVSIAPCALCHTAASGSLLMKSAEPLSGGTKIACGDNILSCFGTVYSKNLTPDSETGLGNWTDQQIKRAIRSGVTKEGLMMHWQAMPWDIFSNFTEADLEAIVAYLRSLPSVKKALPAPTRKAPRGYIIYLGKDYGRTQKDQ